MHAGAIAPTLSPPTPSSMPFGRQRIAIEDQMQPAADFDPEQNGDQQRGVAVPPGLKRQPEVDRGHSRQRSSGESQPSAQQEQPCCGAD